VRRRGYTLLEVLLSFFIISIVLMALVNLYPMSYLTMRRGEHLLAGDNIAQNILEEAVGGDYEALQVETTTPLAAVTRDEMAFTPSLHVGSLAGIDPDVAKEVVVTVHWRERGYGEQSATQRRVVTHVPY
jgi:prepilin-type N-terminal cleavage/methylation domain-containing protein